MSNQLYSAARIAEATGVSRQFISRYVKNHCPESKVGSKIDISNPAMQAFFESKNVDLSSGLGFATERSSHLAKKPVSQSESKVSKEKANANPRVNTGIEDVTIREHGDLSIREISAYFGSDEMYRGWLDARKKQIDIIERELKVKERLGELISRDMVKNSMIGLVDGFTGRLLTDFCKSSPIDLRAAFESGKDNIEIEKILRKLLTQQLDPITKKVAEMTRD